MSALMKKITTEVIASLNKLPSPEKNGNTFWGFMKEQLYSDSTWDQEDLKIIEQEINKNLSSLGQNELTQLWEGTDVGSNKLDDGINASSDEMKEDLTGEILGKVMDRMDDNYSGGSYYQQSASFYNSESSSASPQKENEDSETDSEKDPDEVEGEDIDLDDEDLFIDDNLDDEDEDRY